MVCIDVPGLVGLVAYVVLFSTGMKILVIAGLAESLLNFRGSLLIAMIDSGLDVHVAAPALSDGCPLRLQLEDLGVSAHNIPLRRTGLNPLVDLCSLLSLWGLMCRIRPDVVLAYTIKPVIYGTLSAWLAGVPRRYALITGLGYAFSGNDRGGLRAKVKLVLIFLFRLALARATKTFFQNRDDQNLFFKTGLLDVHSISFVVNGSGVDLNHFSVSSLPPGPPHFLLIARLLGDKGVREYAHAAQRIRFFYPYATFSLVGWFDENPDSISKHELDEWVSTGTLRYLGRLHDVRPAIASCSVFVLPSYREGMPRTVLEAMAMGRAVITTDVPGCRDTVVDADNGFLVPAKSVDALVAAMQRFIQDPDLARRMGHRGRNLAEEKFDVHMVNDVMLREMGLR